jgi:hypothetical protein
MSSQDLVRTILHTQIIPALDAIGNNSLAAQELVLGTGVHESLGFTLRRQLRGGPAVGLFQMEPVTFKDLWKRVIPKLSDKVQSGLKHLSDGENEIDVESLATNDKLAAALCRIKYLSINEPLPPAGYTDLQARYWKKYYNTILGKGTSRDYLKSWNRFVNPFTFKQL